MSEDRTQPASKRRRQLARDQGQVAHSPELTAAAGWLVAVLVLNQWGGVLGQALVALMRGSLSGGPVVSGDAALFVSQVRGAAMAVAAPLGMIVAGFAAGALAAHQMQVRGLWATGLIAPDPARLWAWGRGGDAAVVLDRIVWAMVKAVVLVAVSYWAIRAEWTEVQRLGALEIPVLSAAAGRAVVQPLLILGVVMLLLGLADLGIRFVRFEAMLRTTTEEQREDQRVMEGDLSLRAKRRRLARARRGDAPELLAGASLLVVGPGGLTVVIAGGPPSRRLTVRSAAQGTTGFGLRHSNLTARLPVLDSPDLARRLAHYSAAQGPSQPLPLPTDLTADLTAIWPGPAPGAVDGTSRS